jgi:ApbE superfamily uncharacterized protein (UPF0280 family)
MTATAARLADGRLHLQHGPIDLLIQAWGEADAVTRAYQRAVARFPRVLPELVAQLPLLKSPLPIDNVFTAEDAESAEEEIWREAPSAPLGVLRGKNISGIAGQMIAACWPYRDVFITPMAAVAGAVADAMLETLCADGDLTRAYVNNGGDIAFHVAPGARLTAGVVADLAHPALHGTIALEHSAPVRGLATSGAGGRSFSRGIADAVTILARSAAAADAAATIVANAVDVDHPAVRRAPASSRRDDSDLGDIPVTVAVGDLPRAAIAAALAHGQREAARLRAAGLIDGAVLILKGETVVVHDNREAA